MVGAMGLEQRQKERGRQDVWCHTGMRGLPGKGQRRMRCSTKESRANGEGRGSKPRAKGRETHALDCAFWWPEADVMQSWD